MIATYLIISAGFTLDFAIKGVAKSFLPQSPTLFVALFFLVAIIFTSRRGVKENVGVSIIFAPFLSIIFAVFIIMLPYYDFTNIFPLLSTNNFYLSSIYSFSYFADFIIFILIMPHLEEEKEFKTGFWAILISYILALLVVITVTLSIPLEVKLFSPFYHIVTFLAGSRSSINIIKMLKLIFIPNILLYLSTAVAFSENVLEKAFNIKKRGNLTLTLCLIVLFVAEFPYGKFDVTNVYSVFMMISVFVFPLLPFLSYLRSKR